MRTPTSSELLNLWESAFDSRPAERALALLALAMPELGHEGAARCSIGTRDDLLLALRERLFGGELASVAHCPACKAMVETSWSASALRDSLQAPEANTRALLAGAGDGQASHASHDSDASHASQDSPAQEFELCTHEHRISYRLPTTADMLAIGDALDADADAARRMLLSRCVLGATCASAPVALACLPQAALDALEAAMAAADPMADIECALECPQCGHGWSVVFDIGSFLWSELHTWAQRLLVDIHQLARTYGWREADILAMSPGRRRLYVEMSAS